MNIFFNLPRFSGELKRLIRQNALDGKPLSIMEDAVFKILFSSDTEDSREALRCLLSACIRREISDVRILNNELFPAHLAAKSARLDVHVTFNDGEVADLEMQMHKSNDDLKTRVTQYTAALQFGQSKRGKSYRKIKRVYQIVFLNDIMFPHSDKLPRRYSYREESEYDRLTEAVEIIFYEMPKLGQRVQDYLDGKTSAETLREDEKWCIYMRYRHEQRVLPLIEELCRREKGIMRAEKEMVKVSREYRKFAREMAIVKNEIDHASFYHSGLTEGHMEEKLDIARKMKAIGRPLSEIAEITGLSSEAIEQFPNN
jgi:predicted transposase/invertase (TIGR01784 family)